MAVTISKTDAKILASLILDEVRSYTAAHPTEYAAFLNEQAAKKMQLVPIKRRQSKKA